MSNESKEGFEKLPHKGEVVNSKKFAYKILELIGQGGFGAVYKVDKVESGRTLAMKCEIFGIGKMEVLSMDFKVLKSAANLRSPHFCRILDRGKSLDRFAFIIMTIVGPNLWDLRMDLSDQKFSIGTSMKAAEQCLMAIEDLHRIGYLHRDIKPGNFCTGQPGSSDSHIIFMLDFGLCRKFIGATDEIDLRRPRDQAPFRGTTRYASINALAQREQSRKDDIESWFYVIVEWTAGCLPWKSMTSKNKNEVLTWKELLRENETMRSEFLHGCPKRHFSKMLKQIHQLSYVTIPDYDFFHKCLYYTKIAHNVKEKDPLDWDPTHEYNGISYEQYKKRFETQSSADVN